MISKLPAKLLPNFIILIFIVLLNFEGYAQGTLEVSGNGNIISNGSNTTSATDFTDFGSVEVGSNKSNAFVLDNTAGGGSPNRRLNNISVSISGSLDFTPINSSLGSLKGSDTPINHLITFTPSSSGLKTATVTISFTNGTNAPYTFVIEGTGLDPQPEINVTGMGITIVNGDPTPSTSDGTSFGSNAVGS